MDHARARSACLIALGLWLAAAPPARPLTPMRAVEPPPAEFAGGPTLSGRTVERLFDDPFELQAFCNAQLGPPPPGRYYQACYAPAVDTVAIPSRKAWPSAKERALLRAHEWAHARGWRHAGAVGLAAVP